VITGAAVPRVRELLAAALLCHVAAGCALNPVSGRPEVVLLSRARERKMGEDEARRVAATMGLVDAPALAAYVTLVGQRLAEQAPGRDVTYTFNVVDAEEPNAFALPGGYVYVSRGLLVLMNSEDELAGVLGH
jgi:predicted Zn-dependent protease